MDESFPRGGNDEEPSELASPEYDGAITRSRARKIEHDTESLLILFATSVHNEAWLLGKQESNDAKASSAHDAAAPHQALGAGPAVSNAARFQRPSSAAPCTSLKNEAF